MKSYFFIFTILFYGFASADCTTSQSEFEGSAATFLIQQAHRENKGATSDFSSKVGTGASAGTATLRTKTETLYFVMAGYNAESVSGIVRCDKKTKKLIAVNLGWNNGDKKTSGVTGGAID